MSRRFCSPGLKGFSAKIAKFDVGWKLRFEELKLSGNLDHNPKFIFPSKTYENLSLNTNSSYL